MSYISIISYCLIYSSFITDAFVQLEAIAIDNEKYCGDLIWPGGHGDGEKCQTINALGGQIRTICS